MFKFLLAALAAIFVSTTATSATLKQMIDGVVDGGIVKLADQLVATSATRYLSKLELVINSPGGGVLEGSIYVSAMQVAKSRGVKINCYVPLLAASMAFTILAHCDQRFALDGALFLWHPPRVVTGFTPLTPNDAAVLATDLATVSRRVSADLRERMPIDAKKFWYHYNAETLHTTSELQKLSPGWIKTVADIPGLVGLTPGNTFGADGAVGMFEPGRIIYIWSKYGSN